jgi:hypothetical protein
MMPDVKTGDVVWLNVFSHGMHMWATVRVVECKLGRLVVSPVAGAKYPGSSGTIEVPAGLIRAQLPEDL